MKNAIARKASRERQRRVADLVGAVGMVGAVGRKNTQKTP